MSELPRSCDLTVVGADLAGLTAADRLARAGLHVEVLDAYGRLHRYGEQMWQHHSEFLLLGYGAYATFVDFCKNALPDIPDQHIAQMVAGIDVLLFRPDAELKRLARLAVDTGVGSAFVQGRSHQEIDDELWS